VEYGINIVYFNAYSSADEHKLLGDLWYPVDFPNIRLSERMGD
jgi:hypothetical protein